MKPIELRPIENVDPRAESGIDATNISLLFEELGQQSTPERTTLVTVEDMQSGIVPTEMLPTSMSAQRDQTPPVKIIGDNTLEIGGQKVTLGRSELRVFNLLLLNPEDSVHCGSVCENLEVSKRVALVALNGVTTKCNLEDVEPIILRGYQPPQRQRIVYQLNPEQSFVDERLKFGTERRDILSAMCKKYADDPRVLAGLQDFVPAGLSVADLPSYRLYRRQKAAIPRISEAEQALSVRQLDEVIECVLQQRDSEDQHIRAVIAANKLCFSMLGLADYITNKFVSRMNTGTWNDLYGSTDDILQSANIALIEAIYTYESTKGSSLVGFVGTDIDFALRHGRLRERRHADGMTRLELEKHIGELVSREAAKDDTLPMPVLKSRRKHLDEDLEASLHDHMDKSLYIDGLDTVISETTARRLSKIIFRSTMLRPIEKFALSMMFGVYDPAFAGTLFTVQENGKTFVYDEHLEQNLIFREGISPWLFCRYFGISQADAEVIQADALEKARNTVVSTLSDYEEGQRWADWMWQA
ncbi:MAG: hypothetical protein ACQR33_06685 [Candidatus Saccharibacteria bacterium]